MGSEEVPDEDPVAAIYHRALPHVYGYLLSRCGDVSLAEDLAAETFMAAVAAVRKPGRPEAPSITTGWLVGVARHKLADRPLLRRRPRRRDRVLLPASRLRGGTAFRAGVRHALRRRPPAAAERPRAARRRPGAA
ncbi:MAG: sigma factor, partial [Trebonia sp.]